MPTKIEVYGTADRRVHVRIMDMFEFGMSIADTKKFIAELERALARLEAAMPKYCSVECKTVCPE